MNSVVLALALWGVTSAINLAGLIVGIRLWSARTSGASTQVRFATPLVIAACTTLVAIALLTTVAGVIMAFGALGGESVDPSQKARILAEGISEAMNMIALATLIATPVSLGILLYARLRKSRSS